MSDGSTVHVPSQVVFPGVAVKIKVAQIFCGDDASLFIDERGQGWACGDNRCNKLGLNDVFLTKTVPKLHVVYPQKIRIVKGSISFASLGPNNTCLVMTDGRVMVMGSNGHAQMSCGHVSPVDKPVWIRALMDYNIKVLNYRS